MATVNLSFAISPTPPDTITGVSVTSLTRSDTGAAPSGISLPIALDLSNGQWAGSFADASPAPYYNFAFTITYGDGSTSNPIAGNPIYPPSSGYPSSSGGARPTSPTLVTFAQLQSQLRIVTADEQTYIMDLLDACTEYAEQALDSSLLTRTITLTYTRQRAVNYWGRVGPEVDRVFLPRGPVSQVNSVIDAKGNSIGFTHERHGHADYAVLTTPYEAPLTIVYQAGYGTDPTDVPSDIKMAIRTHVAHLFERREAADEKVITDVPFSLASFYALRKRTAPAN